MRTEYEASMQMELRAIERQRWADVLARPTVRNIKRVSRMRRVIRALFNR